MKIYSNFELRVNKNGELKTKDTANNIVWKGTLLLIVASFIGFIGINLYSLYKPIEEFTILLYVLFVLSTPLLIILTSIFKKYIVVWALLVLLVNHPLVLGLLFYLFKYILKII